MHHATHDGPTEMRPRLSEAEERIDPRMLQRLVDGELSPDEYRQVLTCLDKHPGAWRRCALAFLEAQALHRDFARLLDAALAGTSAALSRPPPGVEQGPATSAQPARDSGGIPTPSTPMVWKRASAWMTMGQWISLAACLLVGWAVGMWSAWRPAAWRHPPALKQPSGTDVAASFPERIARNRPADQAWGTVQLVADADAPQQQVPVYELPALEPPTTVQQWLVEGSPLASELEELLRRGGFDVHREQHLLAAPLEDGRHAIVPVEGYYLKPARWTY